MSSACQRRPAVARKSCTWRTAIAPSPTAEATRFTEPLGTNHCRSGEAPPGLLNGEGPRWLRHRYPWPGTSHLRARHPELAEDFTARLAWQGASSNRVRGTRRDCDSAGDSRQGQVPDDDAVASAPRPHPRKSEVASRQPIRAVLIAVRRGHRAHRAHADATDPRRLLKWRLGWPSVATLATVCCWSASALLVRWRWTRSGSGLLDVAGSKPEAELPGGSTQKHAAARLDDVPAEQVGPEGCCLRWGAHVEGHHHRARADGKLHRAGDLIDVRPFWDRTPACSLADPVAEPRRQAAL